MWVIKKPNDELFWDHVYSIWECWGCVDRSHLESETLQELEQRGRYVNDDFVIVWKN